MIYSKSSLFWINFQNKIHTWILKCITSPHRIFFCAQLLSKSQYDGSARRKLLCKHLQAAPSGNFGNVKNEVEWCRRDTHLCKNQGAPALQTSPAVPACLKLSLARPRIGTAQQCTEPVPSANLYRLLSMRARLSFALYNLSPSWPCSAQNIRLTKMHTQS